jgi:hypothetical protein
MDIKNHVVTNSNENAILSRGAGERFSLEKSFKGLFQFNLTRNVVGRLVELVKQESPTKTESSPMTAIKVGLIFASTLGTIAALPFCIARDITAFSLGATAFSLGAVLTVPGVVVAGLSALPVGAYKVACAAKGVLTKETVSKTATTNLQEEVKKIDAVVKRPLTDEEIQGQISQYIKSVPTINFRTDEITVVSRSIARLEEAQEAFANFSLILEDKPQTEEQGSLKQSLESLKTLIEGKLKDRNDMMQGIRAEVKAL